VIKTDARDFAPGCIHSQYMGKPLHPFAFHSRKLNDADWNYEIHDKELLAILEDFRECKHSLLGADDPITAYTTHQKLQYFLTTKVSNPRQIRWAQWLAHFNCEIVYRSGSPGGKPDALSRGPEDRLEEGAMHREQTIFKTEYFEVSLSHKKDRIPVSLVEGKKRTTNRLRVKEYNKMRYSQQKVQGWQQHMTFTP